MKIRISNRNLYILYVYILYHINKSKIYENFAHLTYWYYILKSQQKTLATQTAYAISLKLSNLHQD